MMRVSDDGRARLIAREGVRLHPYLDTKRIPTIGMGNTTYPDGRKVTMADPPITRAQADAMFAVTLDRFASGVASALTRTPQQREFDAMVSLAYNIGLGGFRGSTVLRKFNAGDIEGAAFAFMLWDKPSDIIDRREGEMEQFLPGSKERYIKKKLGMLDANPGASVPINATTPQPEPEPASPVVPPPAPRSWSGVISFVASPFKKSTPA